VKDLARRITLSPAKAKRLDSADPREILRGLKAVQDDAIKRFGSLIDCESRVAQVAAL
jgi:hypothetical protein